MNQQVSADVEEIINTLLEQNKQLTLNNAVLQATLKKMQEAGDSPDQSESVGSDEGIQSS